MSIRVVDHLPKSGLVFLKHSYRFVAHQWQHADREVEGDQGFERQFREICGVCLGEGWTVSQQREMQLGLGLEPASGIGHEIDVVARNDELIAAVELKNRASDPPQKNDVIVFFAKLLDYLCGNPSLLMIELCPALMSTTAFDINGLGACIGLGIHPIAPGLRPFPILVDNARLMQKELDDGLVVGYEVTQRFSEFCSRINSLGVTLGPTWFSQRFGNISESKISIAAVPEMRTAVLGNELQRLGTECSALITAFQGYKAGSRI